jgi:hypothetical protein
LVGAQEDSLALTGDAETGDDRGKQSFSFEGIHVLHYSFVEKVITFQRLQRADST